MQLTLTLALDVLRGRFDEGVSDMFSAMCAWVLFANLQANLSPFRCIPHYVTQRDVERNNCSLEPVGYRHFPRPYVSTRGCGYARLGFGYLGMGRVLLPHGFGPGCQVPGECLQPLGISAAHRAVCTHI